MEAKTTHTPGPWEIVDRGVGHELVVHWYDPDADDDGRAVDHGYDVCTIADVDRGDANAALIAAAPCQHEALKDLVEFIEEVVLRSPHYDETPALRARLDKARSALSRVEQTGKRDE